LQLQLRLVQGKAASGLEIEETVVVTLKLKRKFPRIESCYF